MTDVPAPDHYTTIEAAALLGLAVRSVQLMVDRGELDAWKTSGGHRRIARASVERWLRSRGGSGAVVPTAPDLALRKPARTGRPAQASAAASPCVLLIEDSIHYQNLVSLLMRQKFADVALKIAGDGIVGLAMAGQLQPDILIVDILLPGIDGAALISSLRSHDQFSRSRLIVLTSLDEAQRAPYAFALKGVDVVHKSQLVAQLPSLLAAALSPKARGSRKHG